MTRFGLLSSFTPTRCGIAAFSAGLREHLVEGEGGDRVDVVRVRDADDAPSEPPAGADPADGGLAADVVNGTAQGWRTATAVLEQCDLAVVQHEYGIYGGRDGGEALQILQSLMVPSIAVLHSVPSHPDAHQQQILERLADVASATVVPSRIAAQRLRENYLVDDQRVSVIPRGTALAADRPGSPRRRRRGGGPPLAVTWGLLGPGKGIEWAIDALGILREQGIEARYLIAGPTHPKVAARQGESYRELLRRRAEDAGVGDLVEFDAGHRDAGQLADLARRADVMLIPYESTEQVSSGVLVEAVAAARPIVATWFPQARELLTDGAGLLVPQCDAEAMSRALREVLTDPEMAAAMSAKAGEVSSGFRWSAVVERYRTLAERVIAADTRYTHRK